MWIMKRASSEPRTATLHSELDARMGVGTASFTDVVGAEYVWLGNRPRANG